MEEGTVTPINRNNTRSVEISPSVWSSPSEKNYKLLPIEDQVYRAINLARKRPVVFVTLLETYKSILQNESKQVNENF